MSNNPFDSAQTFLGGISTFDADDLFGDSHEEPEVKVDLPGEDKEGKETKNTEDTIPEGSTVDAESLFGDESPESVGDDKDNKEARATGDGSSPKGESLYSSFAQALYGDGLFKFLNEDTVNGINDADSFSQAMEDEINARLDDATRFVKEALEAGVQPDVIAQYQRTIQNLEAITPEQLNAETTEGANLRRAIIRQDLITRGYKQDKVDKQVERIMNSGTDIDEAADSLEAVKEYFKGRYEDTVNEAKEKASAEKEKVRQEAEQFRQAVLEKDKLFEDIPVDKTTRRKAYEAMTKVVSTNDDGKQLNAVQQYADEHPIEFRTMLGIVYAMTDGFTKMGKLLTKSVDKKVNRNLREIEKRVMGTTRQGGSFNFIEGDETRNSRPDFRGVRIDIP